MSVPPAGVARGDAWFANRGWTPFAFQREVWAAMAEGKSGLLHATTGSGKTYAVWMGAPARPQAEASGLQVLWLTPMRALAADTRRALELPLPEMAPQWRGQNSILANSPAPDKPSKKGREPGKWDAAS